MSRQSRWKKQWKKNYWKNSKLRDMKYNKWGYIFLIPFFTVYILCNLIPQIMTFVNSFYENYREGLNYVGPNFVGLENYKNLLTPNLNGDILFFKYFFNTIWMWFLGAIPQFIVAMGLAMIFTNERFKLKKQSFFKTIMYMPNLIMASAFSMLFYNLFSNVGPINQILLSLFGEGATVDFFSKKITVHFLVALMNFVMWFGNTMLVLMAGIMGIDESVFEAASIDGANPIKMFTKIILPIIKPTVIYTFITSLIGGIQMYDVPQILTNGVGTPNYSSKTIIMALNSYLGTSKNYGMSGAISVLLFIMCLFLSLVVYKSMINDSED